MKEKIKELELINFSKTFLRKVSLECFNKKDTEKEYRTLVNELKKDWKTEEKKGFKLYPFISMWLLDRLPTDPKYIKRLYAKNEDYLAFYKSVYGEHRKDKHFLKMNDVAKKRFSLFFLLFSWAESILDPNWEHEFSSAK